MNISTLGKVPPAGTNGRTLSAAHATALAAGGIRPEVVAARGYWTATPDDADEIKRLGHSAELVMAGDALMLPLHDVHGQVALTIARADVPRVAARGKLLKYEHPRGSRLTLDVHPMARAALSSVEEPLWVTEGQKKGDAVLSAGAACCIALPGVWSWKGKAMPAWDAVAVRGRRVFLAFDSDVATNGKVATALRRLRAFLGSRGAEVRVVHLKPGSDGRKTGIDDALAGGTTLRELAGASGETLQIPVPADDQRPELDVSVLGVQRVKADAFTYLAGAGVYRTSQGLVRVVNDDGAMVIRSLRVPDVRAILDRAARCVRLTDEGVTPCLPPRDLAEIMTFDPAPPVPPLRAVVTSPTFTDDGRLLDAPGYDTRTGLLVTLGWTPRPVPAVPTSGDLAEARRWWDEEALVDFPFASDADRTHALALALTPPVREMIDGPTPLFLIGAPARGAGKGKIAKVCLLPSLGPGGWVEAAMPRDDEELRKALTAFLGERRGGVLFDNVKHPIRSAVLAKALTGTTWDDRILGKSEGVRSPIRCAWILTANNPTVSDEIARRIVPIRLVPQTDRPENRSDFRHPELEAWAMAHRGDLLWSLAVFVRAWQAAGCPTPAVRPLGSYEAWTRVVGGVLQVAGYTDFLANREEILEASDPETTTWEVFTAVWWEQFTDRLVAVRELLPAAETAGVAVNGDSERAQTASLGMSLGKRRDRFFGTYQVRQGAGRARREWRLNHFVTPCDTYDTYDPTHLRVAHACAGARAVGNGGLEVSQVSQGVTGDDPPPGDPRNPPPGSAEAIALAFRRAARAGLERRA